MVKRKTGTKTEKRSMMRSPRSGAEIPTGNHPGNTGGKKGRSGRKPNKIKALCRKIVDDRKLVSVLGTIAADDEEKARDRIAAITKLIEYGYGKPEQVVDVTSDGERVVFEVVVGKNGKG